MSHAHLRPLSQWAHAVYSLRPEVARHQPRCTAATSSATCRALECLIAGNRVAYPMNATYKRKAGGSICTFMRRARKVAEC